MKAQLIIAWSITWRSLIRSTFYGLPFTLLAYFLPQSWWFLTIPLLIFSWIIYFFTFILAIRVTFIKHRNYVMEIVDNLDLSYYLEKRFFGILLVLIIVLAALVKIGTIPLASESELKEKYNNSRMKNKIATNILEGMEHRVAEDVLKGMKRLSIEKEQYQKGYDKAVSLGEAGKYQEAMLVINGIEKLKTNHGAQEKKLQRLKSLIKEKMTNSN